jgi:hypothetical protein
MTKLASVGVLVGEGRGVSVSVGVVEYNEGVRVGMGVAKGGMGVTVGVVEYNEVEYNGVEYNGVGRVALPASAWDVPSGFILISSFCPAI